MSVDIVYSIYTAIMMATAVATSNFYWFTIRTRIYSKMMTFQRLSNESLDIFFDFLFMW